MTKSITRITLQTEAKTERKLFVKEQKQTNIIIKK